MYKYDINKAYFMGKSFIKRFFFYSVSGKMNAVAIKPDNMNTYRIPWYSNHDTAEERKIEDHSRQ